MAMAEINVDGRSLQQFIGATEAEIANGLTTSRLESALRSDSSAFQQWASNASSGTRSELASHVVGFLQGDAGEIFAGAWSRCAELRKAAAETKEKQGTTQLIALAEHEFTYSAEPEVDVVVDGVTLGGFKFRIELTCAVKALELQVRDGGIGGVRAGECEGSACISLCGVELWKKPVVHHDLSRTLRWKHVLAIA